MPLFEKLLTGNEIPNQIAVAKKQEAAKQEMHETSVPLNKFTKADKMTKNRKTYKT